MKPYNNCFENPEYGWDAVDCLFAFEYQIMKLIDPVTLKEQYKFTPCDKGIDIKDKPSVDLLLKELKENQNYYANRINEIGRKLL